MYTNYSTSARIDRKMAELIKAFELIVKFESRIVIDGETSNMEGRTAKLNSLVADIEFGVTDKITGLNHLYKLQAA